MRFTKPLYGALLGCAIAPALSADVVISNFSAGVGVGTAFGSCAFTQYKAFGFTMGADCYTLDDVMLSMNFATPLPSPVVSIWSDAGGVPGAEIFVLDNPAVLSGQMDFTFTAGSPFLLAPNTTYWLHIRSEPLTDPCFYWDGSAPATMPSGVATAVGYNFNGSSSSFFNRLEINGTRDTGTVYCSPAVANSTGSPATIAATGSNVAASNNLSLIASSLPNNQFGFFLNSQTQGFLPNPGGSQGNLCLSGAIGRYNAAIFNSGSSGTGSIALDLTNTPTPTGPVTVMAGQTWNFQCWYRDANPGATSNFTDALSIAFL